MKDTERYIQEEFRRELEDTSLSKIRYPSANDFAEIVKEAKKFTGKGPLIFPRGQTNLTKFLVKYFERNYYDQRLIAAYNRANLDFEAEAKAKAQKEKTMLKPIPNEANKKKAIRKTIYQTLIYDGGK